MRPASTVTYESRIQKLDAEYRRYSALLEEVTDRYAQRQASLDEGYQRNLARFHAKVIELDRALEQKTSEAVEAVLPLMTVAQLLAEIQRRLDCTDL